MKKTTIILIVTIAANLTISLHSFSFLSALWTINTPIKYNRWQQLTKLSKVDRKKNPLHLCYFLTCLLMIRHVIIYVCSIFVTIHTPSPYIHKTVRQVVLSRCYAANFAHIWGGGSIRGLRSASVDANRSPPDFVHPYE